MTNLNTPFNRNRNHCLRIVVDQE